MYYNIKINWTDFKSITSSKSLLPQYKTRDTKDGYDVFAFDLFLAYQCTLIDSVEIEEFETSYKNKWNKPLVKKDSDNNSTVTIQPRLGSGLTLITHNFCDKCTWYSNANYVIDEIIEPKVESIYDTYAMQHDFIIDVEHGRISFEGNLATDYKIIVKVNDIIKTIETDFTVNYEEGEITFIVPLTSEDIVKVTYYYATDSKFIIKPSSGKKIKMENVESQFSKNLDLSNYHFYFDTYVYDPQNLPNKMLYKRSIYKSVKDWINESNNKLSMIIPKMDILNEDVFIFVWEYPASRVLKYSEGTELQLYVKKKSNGSISDPIKTINDTLGEIATGTFYCISENE